jgi:hypothetical protein
MGQAAFEKGAVVYAEIAQRSAIKDANLIMTISREIS